MIITTNFDRLTEKALEEVGVVPTVLSTPDQIKGALPLIHTQCCVFKVHGDYLDTRIRNSPAELDSYPQEFDQLLDRILDEFGLIACGWSGDWDVALRNAISRAPSRRFTTYWAMRGEAGNEAKRLMNLRNAQVVSIDDADAFFETVQQTVQSIEEYSQPHPLSTLAAVASVKRYLSEPRYRIQLSDLIDETIDRVVESISSQAFDMSSPIPDSESVTARVRTYEAACSTLLSMAPVAGRWVEGDHFEIWQRAMERLSSPQPSGGNTVWLALTKYPAMLLLYALGLGAVESGRLQFLKSIFMTTVNDIYLGNGALPILVVLTMSRTEISDRRLWKTMERSDVPLSAWAHDVLRPHLRHVIPESERYSLVFDKLEILVSLAFGYVNRTYLDSRLGDWLPLGAFINRWQNTQRIMTEIAESISADGEDSPYVESGLLGETPSQCLQSMEGFKSYLERVLPRWSVFR